MTTPAHWNIEEFKAQQAARREDAKIAARKTIEAQVSCKPTSPEARAASIRDMAADAFRKMGRK